MPSMHDRAKAFAEGPTLKVPFDVWPKDIDHFPPLPFPFLNRDTTFEHWKLVKTYTISTKVLDFFISDIIKVGFGYAFLSQRAGNWKHNLIGEFRYDNSTT